MLKWFDKQEIGWRILITAVPVVLLILILFKGGLIHKPGYLRMAILFGLAFFSILLALGRAQYFKQSESFRFAKRTYLKAILLNILAIVFIVVLFVDHWNGKKNFVPLFPVELYIPMMIFQLVALIGLKDGLGVSEMGIFYTRYQFRFYRWQDVRKINADSTGITIYTFSGTPKTIPSSYFDKKNWDELTSQITAFATARKVEFHSEFKL